MVPSTLGATRIRALGLKERCLVRIGVFFGFCVSSSAAETPPAPLSAFLLREGAFLAVAKFSRRVCGWEKEACWGMCSGVWWLVRVLGLRVVCWLLCLPVCICLWLGVFCVFFFREDSFIFNFTTPSLLDREGTGGERLCSTMMYCLGG